MTKIFRPVSLDIKLISKIKKLKKRFKLHSMGEVIQISLQYFNHYDKSTKFRNSRSFTKTKGEKPKAK